MGVRTGTGHQEPDLAVEESPAMTFVHLFAHDVRHALHAASHAALLLDQQADELDDDTRSALRHTMLSSLQELERTLENVLDLDHIDQLEHADGVRFRLDEVAHQVAASTAPEEVVVETEPAEAYGSEVLVRRALINLVRNAVVHTPLGTQVTVRVRRETPGSSSPRIRIEVEDDGPGIPPGDHERVFEVFHRVGDTTAGPGLGLGLPLVRRIARLHDGDAWIETPSGGGVRAVMQIGPACRLAPHHGAADRSPR